ncbi:ankyrin repeat domain-containing protein [Candidatus Mesenet endosymbiont of Agriotes lineatus]|uniref:ankyrin repeat domain-containing protein n=1 Tax=Candidatus Mesenet endosymbiont of Agriotes lineatus TaxID=3077948 RepID=UPI0030D3DC87
MRLNSRSSSTPKDKSQSTSKDVRNPNLTIHQLIEKKFYKAALKLIKCAELSDLNAKNRFGQQTPLHLAIAAPYSNPYEDNERVDIINALIARGVNVNAQDKDGETAVHYIVRWVFNPGTDKKVKAWVYFNMNTGKVETRDIISILLSLAKCGADVNIEDKKSNTALSYIIRALCVVEPLYGKAWVEERARDIIKPLLKVGACIETQEAVFLMLKTSIKNKYDLETVKLLISSSKTPFDINYKDERRYTALMVALEESRFDIVQFLVKKGLDIKNEQNKAKLIWAMINRARGGNTLSQNIDNATSLDALLSDPLLKEAINIDARVEFTDGYYNVTALEIAALKGNIPALKVLSRHKTNANSKVAKSSGGTGCAVLHRLATQYNKEDTQVKKNQIKNVMGLLVLLFNADLTLRDDYGNTPLDYLKDESLKKYLEEDIIKLRDDINKGYDDNATDFILQKVECVQLSTFCSMEK